MKRPVAGCGRGSPTTSRSALRSGRSPTHSSPSTRVTKRPRCGEGAARRSGMSERRYSPLATLFAATFLSGSATRRRPSRFHGSSCLIQRARPGRAPRPLAASSRPSSARGLVVASSIGSGARRRIDLGCGGRRGHGEHPTARCRWRPLEHWADRLRGARCRVRRTRYGRAGQ